MRLPIIDPDSSGIYRAPSDAAALRERVLDATGLWIEADLGAVDTKNTLLETLARAAAFPPAFGRNWDALADSLQDLPRTCPAYVLHLRSTQGAKCALGAEWMTLLEILGEAAMYWKERGKSFVALIDDDAELPAWK